MTILLIRHAHAGDRSRWDGDDRLRPLSDRGHQQASAIVDTFATYPVERILSSPLRRCVQTVEPLADAYGLDIEEEDALVEGASLDRAQRLLREVGSLPTVLCSHGDVIAAVITDLYHREVVGTEQLRWAKGSTWVLERAPETSGPEIARAAYVPPPA
jgi:broad specificity phosphatase PhoE